ncbi:MAG: hypothetical protein ACI351_05545 [Candidatus Avelusimicrobium sp.]|uniref:hypothetical protein n=1 Tax=Candidatus Avelusimicrobium sp. TaxID=3048833 RepID=UPI003F1091C3
MLKILLKAVILVFIILSIYFIVHPAACSNLMLGRVTNLPDKEIILEHAADVHSEMFVPAGDRAQKADSATQQGVFDTNTFNNDMSPVPTYSQEDIDYAVASRYVELENNYAKENKKGKDAAKEISYIVMDDFELTQQEWEDFLQRATQSNLFNKVRSDMKVAQ